MAVAVNIPCPKLPKIQIPSLTLLGGAELKGLVDLSLGPATDCRLTFSLLLQLMPLVASMACLLKLLNFVGKMQDFLNAATDPPFNKLPEAAKGVLEVVAELQPCIPIFVPGQLVIMLKGILSLIVNVLSCFINQLESLLKFEASIDLNAADGNPALTFALECARGNAKTSKDNLMASLQMLQPLLTMIPMLASMAKQSVTLPDFASISATADASDAVAPLKEAIDSLKATIDKLPG